MSSNVIHSAPRGISFAQYARAVAVCRGDLIGAEAYAQERGQHAVAMAIKALISANDAASFAAATAPITAGYIAQVRAAEITGRLQLRPAMLNTRQIVGTGSATAHFVDEGAPKPMSAGAFSAVQLPPRKVVGQSVLTMETIRASHQNADSIVLNELTRASIEARNKAFIDNSLAGSATFGAPTVQSSGASLAQVDSDLRAVLQVAFDANIPLLAPAWVMHPQSATYLATQRGSGGAAAFPLIGPTGGELLGIKVITSTAVGRSGSPNEKFLCLIDASEVLFAADDAVELSLAQHASVQMNDVPVIGAQSLVSLWQSDLVGLRVEQNVAWRVVRSGAVVVLDNIAF